MKNKKFVFIMISILTLAFLLTACASKNETASDTAYEASLDKEYGDYKEMDMAPEEAIEAESVDGDKLIIRTNISMETTDFTELVNKLDTLIEDKNGYVENSNVYYNNYINSQGLKNGYYIIRIPKENLKGFISELDKIGNKIYESTNKEDISRQYRDTESRLKAIETRESRILALLEKAELMEDIISLERELNNIIYEKENLTVNIKNMDEEVDYATVEVNVNEVSILGPDLYSRASFGSRIAKAIKSSMASFVYSVEGLVISLIFGLPYIIILVIIILIVLNIRKKRLKKKEKIDDNINE